MKSLEFKLNTMFQLIQDHVSKQKTEEKEVIQGSDVARTMEATEAELLNTVFPHPTLSEAMHESILDAMDRVIHF